MLYLLVLVQLIMADSAEVTIDKKQYRAGEKMFISASGDGIKHISISAGEHVQFQQNSGESSTVGMEFQVPHYTKPGENEVVVSVTHSSGLTSTHNLSKQGLSLSGVSEDPVILKTGKPVISGPDENGNLAFKVSYKVGESGIQTSSKHLLTWVNDKEGTQGGIFKRLYCNNGECVLRFHRDEIPAHGRIRFSTELVSGAGERKSISTDQKVFSAQHEKIQLEKVEFLGCEVDGRRRKINLNLSYRSSQPMTATFHPGYGDKNRKDMSLKYNGRCETSPCKMTIKTAPVRIGDVKTFPMILKGKETSQLDLLWQGDLIHKAGFNQAEASIFKQSLQTCINQVPMASSTHRPLKSIKVTPLGGRGSELKDPEISELQQKSGN